MNIARFAAISFKAAILCADNVQTKTVFGLLFITAVGGSSNIRCALVPLKPNELIPAYLIPSGSHLIGLSTTFRFSSPHGISGFGLWKCRLPGIILCLNDNRIFVSPAMPAADSRCPILDLMLPVNKVLF